MGRVPGDAQDFHVTVGASYLVIGLQFSVNSNVLGTGAWIHLVNDYGHLAWTPARMFEVIDSRVSSFWRVDFSIEGQVRIWPELLLQEYFHDDLSDGDPVATEAFARLMSALELE